MRNWYATRCAITWWLPSKITVTNSVKPAWISSHILLVILTVSLLQGTGYFFVADLVRSVAVHARQDHDHTSGSPCSRRRLTMTPQDFFARHWEMLIGRLQGPLTLRFVLQPLTGVILATRVAFRDAREGRPPYFFLPVFTDPVRRPELLRTAWNDIGKVFMVAFALDVVYELIVYRWVYPGQALIIAVILAIIPYLLVRGPLTRILLRVRAT